MRYVPFPLAPQLDCTGWMDMPDMTKTGLKRMRFGCDYVLKMMDSVLKMSNFY